MKKFLKVLKNIIVVLCSLALILIVCVFFYHRIQLGKESELLKGNGTLVKVNNQMLNVYREGKGEDTYVFLSGSGVAAPMYEMKGLYSKFSEDNQIAVVERAGYGYSDQFDDKRDIDTILNQTRKALLDSGLKPPYILVPHSIAGVESIYWAQKYPDEVKGIIALDIGLPHEYVDHKMTWTEKLMIRGMNFLTDVGFSRLFPTLAYDPEVINQDFLTKKEKEIFKAISFKQFFNDNMMEELLQVTANSKKSVSLDVPRETPILFLSAYTDENKNSKFTKEKNKNFNKIADKLQKSDVVKVKGKHSIYLYAPDEIYKNAIEFMN